MHMKRKLNLLRQVTKESKRVALLKYSYQHDEINLIFIYILTKVCNKRMCPLQNQTLLEKLLLHSFLFVVLVCFWSLNCRLQHIRRYSTTIDDLNDNV